MNDLWVVGGEQREGFFGSDEWRGYRTAVVARLTGDRARRVFEYQTPPERRPPGPGSHCFKAATFTDELAYLCTDTEVLICALPDFELRQVISLPCFNDLHHVVPGPRGTLYVAVTGLDAVAEVTPEGELVRLIDALGGDPWERFSADLDYRRVPSTKPHRSHPNYVFFLDGRPWVTRFHQRDAVALEGGAALAVGGSGPHDGELADGRVHFTTTDGHLVSFDLASGERQSLDLNGLVDHGGEPLGWCRGLLIRNDCAWVGFSRIRFTALRRNLSWIRHGFRAPGHHQATRVALYHLRQPTLLREVALDAVRVDAVFSIHAVSAPMAGPGGLP